ncbi:helix-turn-helix domain-containing protein [Dehalococcoidales bacterium]|nr:helix-turn-helix domain-containing protein [Dehalococcoidales bacterium]
MDISYYEVYTMSKEEARRLIIETYLDTGNLSLTARLWHTSRHVVRKWVRRFEEKGDEGIRDRSRRPQSSPQQTPFDK